MKIKIGVLILLFTAIFVGVKAQNKPIDPTLEFNAKFEEYSKKLRSISSDFKQIKRIGLLNNSIEMRGKFYYDASGNISLDYTEPSGNKIVFTKEKFMIVNAGKKTVAAISSNPMLKNVSAMLMACMTGDISQFKQGWNIVYYESDNEYILELIPTDKRAKKMIEGITLHFVKGDMSLSKMEMREPSGDCSTYTFSNKNFNTKIDAKVFEIK